MSLVPPTIDSLLRSNQVLADADALLAGTAGLGGTGGTSSATSALGALGGLDPTGIASDPVAAVTGIANDAILGFHTAIEVLGDANGLVGTVHGITGLGEAIGPGRIGGDNLLTTVLDLPTQIAGGDTSGIGHVVPDVTSLTSPIEALVYGAASDAGLNPAAHSVVPAIAGVVEGAGTGALETPVNTAASDPASALQDGLQAANLPNTALSLASLGQALGLGQLGGNNLLTHVLGIPGDLLAGNTNFLSQIPADLTHVVGSLETVVSGALGDLAHGGALSNPAGVVGTLAGDLGNVSNVEGLLNDVVNGFHLTLEGALDPVAPGTLHGVISVGNTLGLGELGGSNLLTDVLNTPGAVASGNLAPIEHLPSDVSSIVGSIGNLANGVGFDVAANPITSTLGHPATGGGLLGGNLPGQGILGEVTSLTGNVTHGGGLDGIVGTLTGLAGGSGAGGLGGTLAGLSGAVPGLGGGGSGSGSHDLITVAAGPQTPTSGLQVDVLSNGQGGPTHLVDTHVGTADAATPTIANVGLLSGGSFHFPTAGGGGDALSGLVSSLTATAAHAGAGGAPAVEVAPLTHVDLPVAAPHADPLATLAHLAHAA